MKKNGFTLVEIIAVIAVLGLLAVLATTNITRHVNNARNNTREMTLKEAEDAAVSYGLTQFIPDDCGINYIVNASRAYSKSGCTEKSVTISTLISQGFLQDDAKKLNPSGKVVYYKYKNSHNTYEVRAYAAESILN